MEISNARHQAMAGHGLEEIVGCPKIQLQQQQEKKQIRPHPEQPLKCPRCASSNTKFCYYNNYSLSQPRYFCKGCRRYWTQGGSLRNVPVGGGCRKNKRPSSSTSNPSSSSSSSSSKRAAQDQDLTMSCTTTAPSLLPTLSLPPLPYDPSGLTLAFTGAGQLPMKQFGGLEDDNNNLNLLLGSSSMPPALAPPSSQTSGGFLDILRSGFIDMANSAAPTGFDAIYYGSVNGDEEGFGCATTTSCDKDNNGGDNKMQMGLNYPWQDIAAGGGILDTGRDCNNWNINSGVNGSSWQGLINSSLL